MSQETLTVEQSETLQQLQQFHKGEEPTAELPPGSNSVEAQPAPAPVAPVEEPPVEPAPPAAAVVEVDGQQFASEADALKYLQGKYSEVQTERLLDEARIEVMQSALQFQPTAQPAQQPIPVEDPVDMDKFYENPAEYMRLREAKLEEKIQARVAASQNIAQRDAQVWSDFSKKYPDLADSRDIVDLVVNKNKDMVSTLAHRDQIKAMDFVARKTREVFQGWVEAQKPTKVLSNTRQETTRGGNPPVTQPKSPAESNKPLDFTAQIRNMNKR